MLKQVTSLFDYFKKVEADKEYELPAIYGYMDDGYNPPPFNFESAKVWIEKWIKDTVGCGYEETCRGMVDYLNRFIHRMSNPTDAVLLAQKLAEKISRAKAAEEATKFEQEKILRAIQEAQVTGQPILTAQQQPNGERTFITTPTPTFADWANTPIAQPHEWVTIDTTAFGNYANHGINQNYYGTVTIDNEGVHNNTPPDFREPAPPEPTAATPQPPIENLWPNIVATTPTLTEIAQAQPHRPVPGDMTEYGWYDQDIENEITQRCQQTPGLTREDAMVRVFNEADLPATPLPTAVNEPTPEDDAFEDYDWGDDITYPDDNPREER